jgi:hypothetical protein
MRETRTRERAGTSASSENVGKTMILLPLLHIVGI